MPKIDKRVDEYIAKVPDYAKPILTQVREVVHTACPDCEETLKWGRPNFLYNGILCNIAAFKAHAHLNFWKASLFGELRDDESWTRLAKLTAVSDLPSKKVLAGYVKKTMELNELDVKVPKRAAKAKKPLEMLDFFMAAIRKNKKALAAFEKFSPSHQREYIEWIVEAKSDDTRARRAAQAVEWMAEGKSRNWKYM
jgi:hypothetical protein